MVNPKIVILAPSIERSNRSTQAEHLEIYGMIGRVLANNYERATLVILHSRVAPAIARTTLRSADLVIALPDFQIRPAWLDHAYAEEKDIWYLMLDNPECPVHSPTELQMMTLDPDPCTLVESDVDRLATLFNAYLEERFGVATDNQNVAPILH